MQRAIIVTGATGNQGGALIKALLAAHSGFHILALTRNAAAPSARKLAAKSSDITLLQGSLDNAEGIFEAAKQATSNQIWGVFSVQAVAFGSDGTEERQGKALVDSAIKHGVKHFVYSSVDRHGDDSINNRTDVPHFVSKHNIEHHLINETKGKDISWTILRPVAFMENFADNFVGKVFATAWKLAVKTRPLQLVAASDIGVFAAKSFMDVEAFSGKSISLAGDELTYDKMIDVFKRRTGKAPPHTWDIIGRLVLWLSQEMGTMFAFFENQGYGTSIAEVKKLHPGVKDLGTWLEDKSNGGK